jgi:hypothetical protein
MSLVRRRLSWLICCWLAVQIAGYVAAPFALCCEDVLASALPDCCKLVAPGQTCPMHHKEDSDENTCKMRNGCAPSDSALVSLSGGIGVMPTLTSDVIAFTAGDSLSGLTESGLVRAARPDAPPPRA